MHIVSHQLRIILTMHGHTNFIIGNGGFP